MTATCPAPSLGSVPAASSADMSINRASSPSAASPLHAEKPLLPRRHQRRRDLKQCKAKKNRSRGPWSTNAHRPTGKACPQLISARNSPFHSKLFAPHPTRFGSPVEVQICEMPRLWSRPTSDERVSRISLADTPHSSVDDILRAFAEGRTAATSASRPSSTI